MKGETFTILIVGGYGTFGARLVELIADQPRLRIIVAGRDLAKAMAVCARPAQARLEPALFDRHRHGAEDIAKLGAGLVVDAAGPFQAYGADPYRLVRAALAAGADYLDLADATDFVLGIGALDGEARAAGRFALSGMSSFPALSGAALRAVTKGMAAVEHITAGVAPSPHAVVGANVVRAIASYAGRPLRVLRDGRWCSLVALVDSRSLSIAVPGVIPLRRRRFSLVAVPDLALLRQDYPAAQSIWAGASPGPPLLHRLLSLAARAVSLRLLPSLLPFAGLMTFVLERARWGEHRGGMLVMAQGGGETRSWHLIAEGGNGPYVPAMAAAALIARLLRDERPPAGARPGQHALTLADFAPFFARQAIQTGFDPLPQFS